MAEEKDLKERIGWLEEWAGEHDKHLESIDRTLNNHVKTWTAELKIFREVFKATIESFGRELNLLTKLVLSVVLALLAIVVGLIVS